MKILILYYLKKENIKTYFKFYETYIFEISSIKLYIKDNFYVKYELANNYETFVQTKEDLYNDLQILYDFIPICRKIIFQTHFRHNIIYNNNEKLIENREIIYEVVKNFTEKNKNVYHYYPSIIIEQNKNLFDGDTHFTNEGNFIGFEYLYNNYLK